MCLAMQHKKGVSTMIGYVLLVSFAVILGGGLYIWMTSYVPQDTPTCPDGVGLFVKSSTCIGNTLNITVENSGRFDIAGYYIYTKTNPNQQTATTSLHDYVVESAFAKSFANAVLKQLSYSNNFTVGEELVHTYTLPGSLAVSEIVLIPARWAAQSENDVDLLNCADVFETREIISCS